MFEIAYVMYAIGYFMSRFLNMTLLTATGGVSRIAAGATRCAKET